MSVPDGQVKLRIEPWREAAGAVAEALGSSPGQGLAADVAAARLAELGANELVGSVTSARPGCC